MIPISKHEKSSHVTEKLITDHMKLVYHEAHKQTFTAGLSFEDLIQDGTIGLINAVKLYDHTWGTKFSTYATPSIRRAMWKAIGAEIKNASGVSSSINSLRKLVESARVLLEKDLKRPVDINEIAEELGLDSSEVQRVQNAQSFTTSIHEPLGEENDGFTLEDQMPDHRVDVAGEAMNTHLRALLQQARKVLTKKEALVIEERYGDPPLGQKEIAKRLHIRLNDVKNIERHALKKLGKCDTLKDYS